jgi:hypothetical protein
VRPSCDRNAPTEIFSDDATGGETGCAELVGKPFRECFSVDPGVRRLILTGDNREGGGLEFKKWTLVHDA